MTQMKSTGSPPRPCEGGEDLTTTVLARSVPGAGGSGGTRPSTCRGGGVRSPHQMSLLLTMTSILVCQDLAFDSIAVSVRLD